LIIFSTLSLMACSKIEKPSMSLGQFSKERFILESAVNKILNEPDLKKMHEMAFALESARAINCKPIKNECDLFQQILNKTVTLSSNRELTLKEKEELFKMRNEMVKELDLAQKKLEDDWKKATIN